MGRPVLRYFGGKWLLAPWIIEHFPKHRVYVEPFGGGASVLLRKERSYAEVYNDLCDEVVNVFRVLRDNPNELEKKLRLTPYSRSEFINSYEIAHNPIEMARQTIVRSFMGFGSNSVNRLIKTGFRSNSNRSGTTPAHDWVSYPEQIKFFSERLMGVIIENRDYWDIMNQHDSEETLFFLDPPYVHSARSKKHDYQFEFTNDDHDQLIQRVKTVKGMVVLCGYENDLYSSLGWQSVKKETHADGARDRVEVLWFNDKTIAAQSQMWLPLANGV